MIERNKRVGELISREISMLLESKVNDNRLKNVTVLRTEVSKDLKFCRVFFSVMGSGKDIAKALSGFKSSKNFIKKKVFSKVMLKAVPELDFEYDSSIEKASRIMKIINEYNAGQK